MSARGMPATAAVRSTNALSGQGEPRATHGVEGGEDVGRQFPGLPGDEQVTFGGRVEHGARGPGPADRPVGFVHGDPLRQAGRDAVSFDFARQAGRVAGLAVRVEVGHVDDHGGVAVAQQAHYVGGIGEVVFLPSGDEHSVQFA